jgi:hypothetical protein
MFENSFPRRLIFGFKTKKVGGYCGDLHNMELYKFYFSQIGALLVTIRRGIS